MGPIRLRPASLVAAAFAATGCGLVSLSCRRAVLLPEHPFRAALHYDLSTLDPHVEARPRYSVRIAEVQPAGP